MTLSHTPSCVVSPKEKEKVNINNNLAVLPSHNSYHPSNNSYKQDATLWFNQFLDYILTYEHSSFTVQYNPSFLYHTFN